MNLLMGSSSRVGFAKERLIGQGIIPAGGSSKRHLARDDFIFLCSQRATMTIAEPMGEDVDHGAITGRWTMGEQWMSSG